MSENIKTRKYYRVNNGTDWDRMHFVTDANSVDANDGDTMETKVGAIKGITTSTEVTEEGYAADATTVAALNSSLGGLSFTIVDGEPYVKVGADSPRPFKRGVDLSESNIGYMHTSNLPAGWNTINCGFKPRFAFIHTHIVYGCYFQIVDFENEVCWVSHQDDSLFVMDFYQNFKNITNTSFDYMSYGGYDATVQHFFVFK